MEQITLQGIEAREIKDVSGKAISFKSISRPDTYINYRRVNIYAGHEFSGNILTDYKDGKPSELTENFIEISDKDSLFIKIVSPQNSNSNGETTIEYEILDPLKIFISEADRQSARRIALVNISRLFDIPEWEFQTNENLLNSLAALKDTDAICIVKLLKEYFKAYDEWFSFYQECQKKNEAKSGVVYIKKEEQLKRGGLIQKRVSTLNALQQKFDELQISKFNYETFGRDIQGKVISKQV